MTRPTTDPSPGGPGRVSPTGAPAGVRRTRGNGTHLLSGALATALAGGLFLVDALTRLEGAVAVLYVVVILVVARSFGRVGIVVAAGCCIVLTAAAYIISRGMFEEGEPPLRCVVSLCAIGTAAALVLRNQSATAVLADQAELLELAHDPILVSDADRRIVFWNKSAEDLYGWSRGEAIGQPAHRLLATSFPIDPSVIETELARVGRWEGELVQSRKSGGRITVESRWALKRDVRGTPVSILVSSRDISERKKAHAALAESEWRFRNIFDTTRVAIAQLDCSRVERIVETLRSSGIQDVHAYFDAHPRALRQARRGIRIVEANEVTLRLLGSPGHVRPTATLDDILPEDDRSFPASLLALVRGEPAFEGEAEVRTVAGGRVPVLFNLAFPPRGGSYDCVLVSAVDITECKEAQEALLTAQAELARAARVEALGELTAALAHEVNQPLAAVTTSGEAALRWLRRDPPALEEVAASLARVVANGRRAGEIVFRIHGFLAKRPMRREWFFLPELIEEAISLLERELVQGGVRVRREFVPGLPRIYGERVRLQQAIINLMTNGLQAMLDVAIATRLLTVRVRLESDVEMLVQVLDTGVGLTPESQRRLFEPFFTTKANGMGLGLAISRSTIEAHGGRMWASRREDGPGTSIACTVPITTPGVE